jgi:hypothetical protein
MNQKIAVSISVILVIITFIGTIIYTTVAMPTNKAIASYEECAAAGYPILDSYPEQCRAPGGKTYARKIDNADTKTTTTITGTTVCLPHKNVDGPHTMECALGIKTDDGTYYSIGTDPYDVKLSETDRKVEVTGTLKTDNESKYNSRGTITVTSYTFRD